MGLFVSPAWAVKAAVWEQEQPKDFTAGKLENVVVTSLGEVMLGRETKTFFESEDSIEVINALARAGDGKIYAASGPGGVVYQIDGEKVSKFAVLPKGGTIFSLLFAGDGRLLAGTGGGEQAMVYLIDGKGKVTVFYEPKEAKYVWAMARGRSGEIYAATGVEGHLHVVNADGTGGKVLADIKPKNLLCLAFGPTGDLYAGTDTDGLVYRISSDDGRAFVLYDAKEPEISSIVVDKKGNVYASTASADAARPGRKIADKPGGKPDNSAGKSSDKEPSAPSSQPVPKDKNQSGESKKAETKKPKKIPTSLGRAITQESVPKDGNAIYRIDIEGFVTEVFREPVMILSMAEDKGTIYAATGNEGRIYQITPAEDRTTMLAKLEPSQATSLLKMDDGRLLVATANAGGLVWVSDKYASKGSLVSKPLDAGQIVKWGRVSWEAKLPEGTKLSIATRSSNVADEESEAWEDYSTEMDASSPQQIPSVNARFLQYRLTFETTDGKATGLLSKVKIARIEENSPPRISSLEVLSASSAVKKPGIPSKVKSAIGGSSIGRSKSAPPDYKWVAMWKAEDPNKDPLVYDVFFRQLGNQLWIRMAEDTKESAHVWDTRTVGDGNYEVRVVAKDCKGNPPGTELTYGRISDPILVDNTLPEVAITKAAPEGSDMVEVHAQFSDSASSIASADYTVDSDDEWIPIAPADDIFDSPSESVIFFIEDLKPGEHRIAIRVRDSQGNTRYASRSVRLGN
jgi:outer membrane protein assembly factor BamB